ncbi:SCP-like protein [Oesophagostomum dentatum]|uniref:SCP-like protein n=1 Tax=Oesophagostomum dentatum TaxID=61180 RepID=A0A0B1S9Y5_OESDE|nr:SCP-like protein [Oesophagostomum dentatum]
MTDAARQAFLDEHNRLRSSLARGLEDDPLIGKAPKASRMLKMIYDCDVEASAIKHAQKCIFEHSDSSDRYGLGENLFMTTARNYDKTKAGVQASQSWWSELKKYGVGEENKLTMDLFNRGVGHYTQMAWEESYKLGCAVMHCSDMTLVVCQYGPAGNMLNQQIYTKGEPCADCTTTCSKDEGLCLAA